MTPGTSQRAVAVAVGEAVGVAVEAIVGVAVGVPEGVAVADGVRVNVAVGAAVSVEVGLTDAVAVGVDPDCPLWPVRSPSPAQPARTRAAIKTPRRSHAGRGKLGRLRGSVLILVVAFGEGGDCSRSILPRQWPVRNPEFLPERISELIVRSPP